MSYEYTKDKLYDAAKKLEKITREVERYRKDICEHDFHRNYERSDKRDSCSICGRDRVDIQFDVAVCDLSRERIDQLKEFATKLAAAQRAEKLLMAETRIGELLRDVESLTEPVRL